MYCNCSCYMHYICSCYKLKTYMYSRITLLTQLKVYYWYKYSGNKCSAYALVQQQHASPFHGRISSTLASGVLLQRRCVAQSVMSQYTRYESWAPKLQHFILHLWRLLCDWRETYLQELCNTSQKNIWSTDIHCIFFYPPPFFLHFLTPVFFPISVFLCCCASVSMFCTLIMIAV